MPDQISTSEAAELLGISRARVLVLITEKRLPAERIGTVWVIKKSDLSKVRVRKTGRPKKV